MRLVESGLGTKTPRQGKKQVTCRHITIIVIVVMMIVTHTGDYTNNNDDYQVGTVTKMRDRMTASPPVLSPQPSAEQVIIIWIFITLITLLILIILL